MAEAKLTIVIEEDAHSSPPPPPPPTPSGSSSPPPPYPTPTPSSPPPAAAPPPATVPPPPPTPAGSSFLLGGRPAGSVPTGEPAGSLPRGEPAGGKRLTTRYETEKGSTYEVHPDGTTTRDKATRDLPGHEGDSGLKERSARTIYVETANHASALSSAGMSGLGPQGSRLSLTKDNLASLLTWNHAEDRWGTAPSSRNIPFSNTPQVGWHPVEAWNKTDDIPGREAYRGQHAGSRITRLTSPEPAATPWRDTAGLSTSSEPSVREYAEARKAGLGHDEALARTAGSVPAGRHAGRGLLADARPAGGMPPDARPAGGMPPDARPAGGMPPDSTSAGSSGDAAPKWWDRKPKWWDEKPKWAGSMPKGDPAGGTPDEGDSDGHESGGKRRRGFAGRATRGFKAAGSAFGGTGRAAAAGATNNPFTALKEAADTASSGLSMLGPYGMAAGAGLQAVKLAATAVSDTVAAFAARGRELELWSSHLIGANISADLRSMSSDKREAEKLGPQLAQLIENQSKLDASFRELMLPVKDWVIEKLNGLMEALLDLMIREAESLKRLHIVSDESLEELKKIRAGAPGEWDSREWERALGAVAGARLEPRIERDLAAGPIGFPILAPAGP